MISPRWECAPRAGRDQAARINRSERRVTWPFVTPTANKIAAGDTKVVERGKADGLYVTTAGVGEIPDGVGLGAERVQPGDRVIVSGTLGDHGMAVMIARGGLELDVDLESDTAPVHELVASVLRLGPAVRWMRDRRGAASPPPSTSSLPRRRLPCV